MLQLKNSRLLVKPIARAIFSPITTTRLFTTTHFQLGTDNGTHSTINGQQLPSKNLVEENGELKIKVAPIPRPNEPIENKRRRLLYQSRKRGILESDLLLSRFADKYLDKLTLEQLNEYDHLLDEPDWDIYYWATKNFDVTPLPDKWKDSSILKLLQQMSENSDKEILRMPELKSKE
ncbi:unnamed protein product [Ambrosiozyma monospora]|uniref:Succinate dehydrogenase assembly factor 2, mitochondrial n=1 Tax=Ambrosiozyma monospora TaxID=43982 RepID=A0A9W6Z1M2_AMBMO|nr:unnamed protein product [Ambrosiozyma monospora]